ncbi:MAG: hypothetical protein EBU93_02530 [Chlamydiae bacterium]|nr:hypothetical protein [Chlamydiota bacterium]
MATIQKRKNKNGTLSYKVMIRAQDGFPPAYNTLPSFQEAKEWAILEEAKRKQGTYSPETSRKQQTLAHLVDSYIENILPLKPGSAEDVLRHLIWWKQRIGNLSLSRVTSQIIAESRRELAQTTTAKGTLRSPSTTN